VGPSQVPNQSQDRGQNSGRSFGARIGLAGAIAILLVAGLGGGVILDRSVLAAPASGTAATVTIADQADFSILGQAWQIIQTKYVGIASLDKTKLLEATIDGLVAGTGDTGHTRYLLPAELAIQDAILKGSIVGIGVRIDLTSGAFVVRQAFAGSPAAAAGMKAGDLIVSVDGQATKGLSIDDLSTLVRGPVGSTVTIGITRAGKPQKLAIVRASITVPAVDWAFVPGTKVADLLLSDFSTGASAQLASAISAAGAGKATGLILDLRGNPGGFVDEAVGITSQFLSAGIVYQTRDGSGAITTTPVKPGVSATDLPLVVLVDATSASSSEIVAGALQDAGRAKIVGVTTAGTGTVLNEFPLSDGSALFVGTAEWLTRAGRQIWHHGIVPDLVVPLAKGGLPIAPATFSSAKLTADAQLSAAVGLLTGKP
jgi:carboxyl-terminal processing protease